MKRDSKTETAFLDAAERLFAEHGFEGTRVRAIADESHANLGTLHYYWGSKEALFGAVWKRRMLPLVEKRRSYLQQALAKPEQDPVDLEELIRVWVEAALGVGAGDELNESFQRLYGRALTDPSPAVREVVGEYMDETGKMLVTLLKRACPNLTDTEIYWRMHGLLGAVLYAHIGRFRLDRITPELDASKDLGEGARQLIHFLTAGFLNPSLPPIA
jgi:AcrR family transcriptional regulator